jgi:hypothetical protein
VHVRRSVLLAILASAVVTPGAAAATPRNELHLLDADTGADRAFLVSPPTIEYLPLEFSAGGDALTVARSGRHTVIQRLSLADGTRTTLSSRRLPDAPGALSIDHRFAGAEAIVRGRTVRWHVRITRLSGRLVTWLPRHYLAPPSLAWSPDGERLIVVGPDALSHGIYRWRADTFTRGGRLAGSLSLGYRPAAQVMQLSADGARALLNLWPRDPSTARATVLDLRTGGLAALQPTLEPLTSGGGAEPVSWPAWSPAGDVIVATREPGLQIELFDGASLDRTQILVPPAPIAHGRPTWSPNGQRVLLTELGDQGTGILMIDLAGPTPVMREVVPIQPGDIDAATWAPDSRTIAYDRI